MFVILIHFVCYLNLGSNIDDIISSLRDLNIQTEILNGSDYVSAALHSLPLNSSGYVSVAPHSAALNVFHADKVTRNILVLWGHGGLGKNCYACTCRKI